MTQHPPTPSDTLSKSSPVMPCLIGVIGAEWKQATRSTWHWLMPAALMILLALAFALAQPAGHLTPESSVGMIWGCATLLAWTRSSPSIIETAVSGRLDHWFQSPLAPVIHAAITIAVQSVTFIFTTLAGLIPTALIFELDGGSVLRLLSSWIIASPALIGWTTISVLLALSGVGHSSSSILIMAPLSVPIVVFAASTTLAPTAFSWLILGALSTANLAISPWILRWCAYNWTRSQ